MSDSLVTGPLTNTQTETGATKLRGWIVSNTHATDSCAFIIKSKDTNGKVLAQGSCLAGDTVIGPHNVVGCDGVYISLTGGTGAVIVYFN